MESRLGKILVPEGTNDVAVNTPIAMILAEGEDKSALKDGKSAQAGGDGTQPVRQQKATESASPPDKGEPAKKAETRRRQIRHDQAAVGGNDARSRRPGRHRDGHHDHARGVARRHGRGNAPRCQRVRDRRGSRRVSGRLQGDAGAAAGVRRRRVIDTPITEHAFAGLGVGAALAGLKPIVEFMTFNFAMQAMDHLINSAAKTRYMSGGQADVAMVFRGPNGAAARVGAQHSQDFTSWYSHVPGLKVIAPSTAADAKGLLKAAIRDPNPVIFLENEILYGASSPVPKLDDYVLPIGRARVVRAGNDVTLVAWSIGMTYALKAADELANENISAEVIDLRTLKPMDTETIIESVKKTGRLVTIEEGWKQSGVGAEIAARMMEEAFDYLDAPVMRVTGKDVPMPYAANLEKLALPSVAEVVEAAKAVCYR